jgi:hypothetical protein
VRRALFKLIIATLLVSGCKEAAPQGDDAANATVTPAPVVTAQTPSGPSIQEIEAAHAACRDTGGKPSMSGAFMRAVCVFETKDAGASCTSSADCDSICLAPKEADSEVSAGQCAPQTPYLGCHKVVENGAMPILCME